jgi:hypothetical protein
MENRRPERSKIANASYAMMATAKTPMQLYSVMVATWQYTRNATESHSFPRASGFVEDVS